MRFNNLNDWLKWQESLNPKEIDLGLNRVTDVLKQAGLATVFNCPLITVAGTNGKGSVVAMLEAIAQSAGLKVCSYTSPHIFRYNERIKVNGSPVDDNTLCKAFERIDLARGELALTYFEFGTLAAIEIFFKEQPDLIILEVGLGGRLDAVNIMDADISILTSVAIDHVEWLGDNRESIGFEKAGVFRALKPVICGDSEPPLSVISEAEKKQCDLLIIGQDFKPRDIAGSETGQWQLFSRYADIKNLPAPSLSGYFQKNNAAMAIVALQTLQSNKLLETELDFTQAVKSGLKQIKLKGRFQKINHSPAVYVDVAHNPQAAQALSTQLKLNNTGTNQTATGKTWAIVAMLADKDINGVLQNVSTDIDNWCFAGLNHISRGMSVLALYEAVNADIFRTEKVVLSEENRHEISLNQCTILCETVLLMDTVKKACQTVLPKLGENDRVIIFGSFYTVAEALNFFCED